jgi:hypothetical protein
VRSAPSRRPGRSTRHPPGMVFPAVQRVSARTRCASTSSTAEGGGGRPREPLRLPPTSSHRLQDRRPDSRQPGHPQGLAAPRRGRVLHVHSELSRRAHVYLPPPRRWSEPRRSIPSTRRSSRAAVDAMARTRSGARHLPQRRAARPPARSPARGAASRPPRGRGLPASLHCAESGLAASCGAARAPARPLSIDLEGSSPGSSSAPASARSDPQREAVRQLRRPRRCDHRRAGTGKTTLVNAVIQILEKKGPGTCSPRPPARRQAHGGGHRPRAKTLHRLPGVHPKGAASTQPREPAEADLIVVDETAISTRSRDHLLRAVPAHAQLVLVGTWTISRRRPRSVLGDLIRSPGRPRGPAAAHLSAMPRTA